MIKISSIKSNPNNPRVIKDDKFEKLKKSIQDFPKMMALRPIIVDEKNVILGGNMRFKAIKELGFKEVPEDWIKKESELSEDEKKQFIVKDNVGFGEWDWAEINNNWDIEQIKEWGLEIKDFYKQITVNEHQRDLSDDLKTNFRIEILLDDEKSQEILYNELTEKNYKCRILTL